jgi:hypothetical protein
MAMWTTPQKGVQNGYFVNRGGHTVCHGFLKDEDMQLFTLSMKAVL